MLLICLDYILGVFNMPRLYSPSFLKTISTSISSTPLAPVLWRCLVNHGISKSKPTRRGCRAGQRKLKSKGNTSPTPLDSQPCKIINGKEIYEIHEDQYLHNTLPGTLNIQTVTSANAASWDFPQRSTNVNNSTCINGQGIVLGFPSLVSMRPHVTSGYNKPASHPN